MTGRMAVSERALPGQLDMFGGLTAVPALPAPAPPGAGIRIEVTLADIRQGAARSTRGCPLGLAIGRAVGEPVRVWCVHITLSSRPELFLLPDEAIAWRRDHDAGRPVEPFAFELEPGQLTERGDDRRWREAGQRG